MTDIDKILEGLHRCLHVPDCQCYKCPYDLIDLSCRSQLESDIQELINSQLINSQLPRVLTFEELLKLSRQDYTIVFVEENGEYDCYTGWGEPDILVRKGEFVLWCPGCEMEYVPSPENYNVTWRCWNLKPSDELMESTKWLK